MFSPLWTKSIRWKMAIFLLFPALLTTGILIKFSTGNIRRDLISEREQLAEELTNVTLSLLRFYHNQESKGILTATEAQKRALETIGAIRYGNNSYNYFWINDTKPNVLLHPYRSDLLDVSEAWKDIRDLHVFERFVDIVKQNGRGVITYPWQYYDDRDQVHSKLSYVAGFEPWEWIVGTGIYIKDIESLLVRRERTTLMFIIGLVFAQLFTAYSVLRRTVITRLEDLSRQVTKIGEARDPSQRVIVEGEDELTELGSRINYMLFLNEFWQIKLNEQERKYRSFFTNMRDGIVLMTPLPDESGRPYDYRVLDYNPALRSLLGIKKDDQILKLSDILYDLCDIPSEGSVDIDHERSKRFFRLKSFSVGDEKIALVVEDITEQRRYEDKLKYLSYHDSLTKLHNRSFFETELKHLDAQEHLPLSILIVDVSGLKLINDAFGHRKGDKVLYYVGQILNTFARQDDVLARWGGDEFAMLLPRTTEEEADRIQDRINGLFSLPWEEDIPVYVAIGVATKRHQTEKISRVMKKAEDRMFCNKLAEGKASRNSIMTSLTRMLREKSLETESHTQRLREMSVPIGQAMNLSHSQLDELSLLAALHDIGKVGISSSTLSKKGPLNDDEWRELKRHPEIGYRIALSFPELAPIAQGILTHHEHWDGNGYPQKLAGKSIPIIARILAVVDAFDVITNGRSYRAARTEEEALRELERCSGSQFDPEVVCVFVQMQWERLQGKRSFSL